MSPMRVSAWMACNNIQVLASSWLLNKSGQSFTFEDVKFFVVDESLTGYDITCSFFGIGKKTVLKTLKDNIDEFADLNKLCLLDSETSIDISRNFVAKLYVHFIITIFICSLSQRVATCISPLTLTYLSAGQILFSTNTTLRTRSE
jgi:hypothetical protein